MEKQLYKKYAEIVFESDNYIIATVWTGPNYYISLFPTEEVSAIIANWKECTGKSITRENAIESLSVSDMDFLCRHEDYSPEDVQCYVQRLLEIIEHPCKA